MTTALAAPVPAQLMEQVLIGGDLSRLAPADRVMYYTKVCESVGLNPLTKPFEYITLNGKLTLYAKRDCTDQLRANHGVSILIVSREVVEDCYVVTARATDKTGRHDESIGAVPIGGLKGENRSNAMMKAETKAKRRVTLSVCGLGLLDETEVGSIPGAYPEPAGAVGAITAKARDIVSETAAQIRAAMAGDKAWDAYQLLESIPPGDERTALWAMLDSKIRSSLTSMQQAEKAQTGAISDAQHKRLEARIREMKFDREALKQYCQDNFGKQHFPELSQAEYQDVDRYLDAHAPKPSAPSHPTAHPLPEAQASGADSPKLARIKSVFGPLNVTMEQVKAHLQKDPVTATKAELQATYEHFETLAMGPGDDFVRDMEAAERGA